MRRLAYRLRFFVRSALRGLAGTPVTSSVAIGTIAITLLLAGVFALLLSNMGGVLHRAGESLKVTAYLEEGLAAQQRRELMRRISGVEGVESTTLVSEAEALARFQEGVGAKLGLLDALEENPLPASLEIRLVPERRSADGVRSVAHALHGLPGIAEIGHGQRWVEGYARTLSLLRGVGLGFGALLAFATLLVVANTIRLAVYARQEEIEILTLVGAGRAFVAVPFLIEGFVQGLLGGLLAMLLLYAVYAAAMPGVEEGLELLLGYARPHFLGLRGLVALVGCGALLGSLGSATALVQGWRQ
jgi:cell division transport system permease protein